MELYLSEDGRIVLGLLAPKRGRLRTGLLVLIQQHGFLRGLREAILLFLQIRYLMLVLSENLMYLLVSQEIVDRGGAILLYLARRGQIHLSDRATRFRRVVSNRDRAIIEFFVKITVTGLFIYGKIIGLRL